MPLKERRRLSAGGRRPLWICRSVSGGVCRWSTDSEFLSCLPKKGTKEGHEGLRRPARAAPGARYARRPLAGAPPRDPGLSPLRGPGPAGRILYKDGLRPNPCDPNAASGWPAAKVGGALFTDQRTSLQHPASRRAAGAMPLPESLRSSTESAFVEARPLLHGAQRPRGGGKLRGFAAHARRARERPERALFSAVRPRRTIRLRLLGASVT